MDPVATNYGAWNIEPVAQDEVTKKELYRNIVGWAILAPNSHNVQPWRFIIHPSKDCIDVCLPRSGILPASDKKSRQAHISIGCALENLLRAAEYYGLAATFSYCPGSLYPSPLVRVKLERSAVDRESKEFLNAMKNRRINRGKFYPERLVPSWLVEEIQKITSNPGLVFDAITDTLTRIAIAEIQYAADRAVVAFRDFRQELAEYVLPNDTENGIGMPGNAFGLTDEMAVHVHRELKKGGAFDPALAVGMAASSRDGIRSSPLIGIIGVREDNPEWWIKAGMALQKIALFAEMNGLALAVHAAIVEINIFNKLLGIRLKRKERSTVIFRIGYPTEERPHSPRLSVEEVSEIVE